MSAGGNRMSFEAAGVPLAVEATGGGLRSVRTAGAGGAGLAGASTGRLAGAGK